MCSNNLTSDETNTKTNASVIEDVNKNKNGNRNPNGFSKKTFRFRNTTTALLDELAMEHNCSANRFLENLICNYKLQNGNRNDELARGIENEIKDLKTKMSSFISRLDLCVDALFVSYASFSAPARERIEEFIEDENFNENFERLQKSYLDHRREAKDKRIAQTQE